MKSNAVTTIVGIGSAHGDDRIGWEIAQGIAELCGSDVAVRLASTPSQLLDWLDGVEHLVICDACRGAGESGSLHCWTWPSAQLDVLRWSGTHEISLPAVLALAQQLGKLPQHVIVWAVETETTQPVDALSANVQPVLDAAVHKICCDLNIAAAQEEV